MYILGPWPCTFFLRNLPFLALMQLLATLTPIWVALWVLWRLRWGGGSVGKGLRLANSGRAADAVQCYRKALLRPRLSSSERAELLCCLGDAFMDLGRYEESRKCLDESLAIGDPTGNCRASIAELLLLQGTDAKPALELAEQAFDAGIAGLAEANSAGAPGCDLASVARATILGQQAWALALLDRQEEARGAVFHALQFMMQPSADLLRNYYGFGPAARLGRACTYWHIGMALLVMHETGKAKEHYKKGSDADPKGKYGARCRKQLALM